MGEAAVQALASASDDSLTTITTSTEANAFSRDELLSSLVLCAVGLRESGRFSFIAQGLLQVLKSRISPRDQSLLGRFLAESEGPDDDALGDMQEKAERYNQSNLPINLFSMKMEPEQTLKKSLLTSSFSSAHVEEEQDSPSTGGDGGSGGDDDESMTPGSN